MSRKTPPPPRFPRRPPKGAESVGEDAEGRQIIVMGPNQVKIRWPGVEVFSTEFAKLSVPEMLYERALAFLRAAKLLCNRIGADGIAGKPVNWSQCSVCLYCLYHATELFLKACISCAGTEPGKKPTHSVATLRKQYKRILHDPAFHFELPSQWKATPSYLENIEKNRGEKLFAEVDKKLDQLFRYGINMDGEASGFTYPFEPNKVFYWITDCERVWPQAWKKILSG